MRPRHFAASLLAATLASFGCGASGIASDSGTTSPSGQVAQASSPTSSPEDFLARSGFLGFSSVTDRAVGQNRYLVFTSRHKLLPADTNNKDDVYLRDLRTGALSLISVSSSEVLGNGASSQGSISADGRYVAFRSAASNLVAGDNNGFDDIFVRDRFLGTTTRVSVSTSGTEGNAASQAPAISNKNVGGPFVVFSSTATNLVGTDSNNASDIFVRDLSANTTTLVSSNSAQINSASGGSFDPAITFDGAQIAFSTAATDILSPTLNGQRQIVRIARATPSTRVLVSQSAGGTQANGACYEPSLSSDGTKIAYFTLANNLGPTDSNGFFDVYLRDTTANTVSRVSVDSGGGESNGHSGFPSLSNDGLVVAFASLATDLVASDTNGVFDVFSRAAGVTSRASVSTAGTQADVDCDLPAISLDGRYVAFRSAATNLIAKDALADDDINVRQRTSPLTTFWGTVRCLFPGTWPGYGSLNTLSGLASSRAIAYGDIDGDGDIDLAIANLAGNSVAMLLNDGLGGFTAQSPINIGAATGPVFVQLVDLNGDGSLDLTTANNASGSISVCLNNGSGTFGSPTAYAGALTTSSPLGSALGDLDGDGDLDLLLTDTSVNSISIFFNDGTGNFGAATVMVTGSSPRSMALGDIDNDGDLDLSYVFTNNVAVCFNNGSGSFTQTAYSVGSSAKTVVMGDYDKDGDLDLAVSRNNTNPSTITILSNSGNGVCSVLTPFNVGNNLDLFSTADVDGDDDLDLVMPNLSGNDVSVYLNDGSASFTLGTTLTIGAGNSPRGAAVVDLDLDGDLDIALPNFTSGNISTFFNQARP